METFKVTRELLREIGHNLKVDGRLVDVLIDRLWGQGGVPGFQIENRDQAVSFVVKQLQTLYS